MTKTIVPYCKGCGDSAQFCDECGQEFDKEWAASAEYGNKVICSEAGHYCALDCLTASASQKELEWVEE